MTTTSTYDSGNLSRALRAAKELAAESNHARRYQLSGEIDALVGRVAWNGSEHRLSRPREAVLAAGLPERHVVEGR